MRAGRRTAVTASGVAALALAGCSSGDRSPTGATPSGSASTAPTASATTSTDDPDQAALEQAVALTTTIVALIDRRPQVDPTRELAELHASHLAALTEVSAAMPSETATPVPSGPRPSVKRLRRQQLAAQRELAALAVRAESGAVARLLASMSAGIGAALSHRGEVPR